MELMLKSRPAATSKESQTIPSDTATSPTGNPILSAYRTFLRHVYLLCVVLFVLIIILLYISLKRRIRTLTAVSYQLNMIFCRCCPSKAFQIG